MPPRAVATVMFVACALVGCAQTPAASGVDASGANIEIETQTVPTPDLVGPILGTVEVWLDESGILLWQPRVDVPGAYRLEVTNVGQFAHDLTVLRWDGSPASLPNRDGRVVLQGLDVLAQSPTLAPEDTATIEANLDVSGTYVLLSSRETDFGDGMVTTIRAGSGSSLPVPMPTPELGEDDLVHVYLLDRALILSDTEADDGLVMLKVQNVGPSRHDVVIVRWRGDPHALPVDDSGNVMPDALEVVAQLPALDPGEEVTLDVELDEDLGYVLYCSLDGNYEAGMAGQIFTR